MAMLGLTRITTHAASQPACSPLASAPCPLSAALHSMQGTWQSEPQAPLGAAQLSSLRITPPLGAAAPQRCFQSRWLRGVQRLGSLTLMRFASADLSHLRGTVSAISLTSLQPPGGLVSADSLVLPPGGFGADCTLALRMAYAPPHAIHGPQLGQQVQQQQLGHAAALVAQAAAVAQMELHAAAPQAAQQAQQQGQAAAQQAQQQQQQHEVVDILDDDAVIDLVGSSDDEEEQAPQQAQQAQQQHPQQAQQHAAPAAAAAAAQGGPAQELQQLQQQAQHMHQQVQALQMHQQAQQAHQVQAAHQAQQAQQVLGNMGIAMQAVDLAMPPLEAPSDSDDEDLQGAKASSRRGCNFASPKGGLSNAGGSLSGARCRLPANAPALSATGGAAYC